MLISDWWNRKWHQNLSSAHPEMSKPTKSFFLSLRQTLTTEAAVTLRSSSLRRTRPRPSCQSLERAVQVPPPRPSRPMAAAANTQVAVICYQNSSKRCVWWWFLQDNFFTSSCHSFSPSPSSRPLICPHWYLLTYKALPAPLLLSPLLPIFQQSGQRASPLQSSLRSPRPGSLLFLFLLSILLQSLPSSSSSSRLLFVPCSFPGLPTGCFTLGGVGGGEGEEAAVLLAVQSCRQLSVTAGGSQCRWGRRRQSHPGLWFTVYLQHNL